MSKTAITSPELAPPVGPFSQAVKIDGFLFFSGQVAQDPATGKVVEGGIGRNNCGACHPHRTARAACGSQYRFCGGIAQIGLRVSAIGGEVRADAIDVAADLPPFARPLLM